MPRILVVDDDPDVLGLVSFRLRKQGHEVLAVGDGPAALAIVDERGAPDLAVLDVSMPGMTGLQLLGALRRRPGLDDLKAIFLSARVLPEDIAAGQQLGATYLTKPFVAPALLDAVNRALGPADRWASPGPGPAPEPEAEAEPAPAARRKAASQPPPGY
jgi:CheY-like chemotaxis protein